MEDQRRMMMASILTVEAKERLARVAMVKPDNARAVENHLISLVRGGRLREQVSEGALIKMLEEIAGAGGGAGGGPAATRVRVQRKKRADEDSDDDDDGDF